jgi:hypothetical protein
MPLKSTIEKARKDAKQGKSPSTQAGEFVHDEIDKIRKGEHGARSAKQAIAIGLSEARRAGVKLPPPKGGSPEVKRKAEQDSKAAGKHKKFRRSALRRPRERSSAKGKSRFRIRLFRAKRVPPPGSAQKIKKAKSALPLGKFDATGFPRD